MRSTILSLTILFATTAAAIAGVGTITGKEWGPSAGGNFCVIVARASKVIPADMGEDKPHVLQLHPLATLAGNFDPSLQSMLTVECYTRPMSSIRELPKDKSLVVAAIKLRDRNDPDDRDMIVSAFCTFMPKQSSLVQITGLDDPLYHQTLRRLREERAIAVSRAATQPTTQPAR